MMVAQQDANEGAAAAAPPQKHTRWCGKETRIWKARTTRFLKRYPNYCRACDAYGIQWYEDHESILQDTSCSGCIDKGLCPRCMTPTLVEKQDLFYTVIQHFYDTCTMCGWRGDDDYDDKYTLPRKPECYCHREWAWEKERAETLYPGGCQ